MLRRALEVAAVTGAIAIAAGLAAILGLGETRALPAIVGAGAVAGIVFHTKRRDAPRAILAAALSGLAAFGVDWFVLFVLGAGYPEVRDFRRTPHYQALVVILFGAIAALDARPTPSAAGAARS